MNELEIYIDGASRGNPGPSGVGIVIIANGKTIRRIHRFIGQATNNTAEYTALICALEEGLRLGAKVLSIKTDSELLCRQFKGVYRVRSANIRDLYARASRLISGFSQVAINHVPREQNRDADRLANQAFSDRRSL